MENPAGNLRKIDPSMRALALALGAAASATPSTPLNLLLLGDWGGAPAPPYSTPPQLLASSALAAYAAAHPVDALLALGDNFYNLGLCNNRTLAPYNNSCPRADDPATGTAHDARFAEGFEAVYDAPPLRSFPWYIVAGNHDALGNVSASIAYSALSPNRRWRHPDFFYKLTFPTRANPSDPLEAVDVLMLDVTLCYGIWSDPAHDAACAAQLAWLTAELSASRAAYLLVGGHYPIYSPCAHGNTQWAIDTLLPLLLAHNATAYLSGHDHCAALLAPALPGGRELPLVVQGMGDGCCYNYSNILAVPGGSLKYLLAAGPYAQGAPSGFSALRATARGGAGAPGSALSVGFYSAAGGAPALLYTSPLLLPRTPQRDGAGAVVGMAAPDYAREGLPPPSRAAPFAPYPQARPGAEAASVDAGEGGALPVAAAALGGAPAGGELIVWLYAPTAVDNATWAGWYASLSAHRANVTGVSPCSYLVDSSGAFTTQMPTPQARALAAGWTRRMAGELGLAAIPLIAASGSGMNALLRAGNGAARAAFIAATVAELRAIGGAGYNVQLEEPGNATIKAEWVAFLGAWADALAPATIALILGGDCRARDWMYMDCGDYRLLQQNHSNVRAITEATYEKEPAAWKDFERNIVRGLGAGVAQLGLEYGPPLRNPGNGCLPQARASGVRTLYVWVDPPAAGAQGDADWDAFGWWTGGGA